MSPQTKGLVSDPMVFLRTWETLGDGQKWKDVGKCGVMINTGCLVDKFRVPHGMSERLG